jgi:hypothetical protein
LIGECQLERAFICADGDAIEAESLILEEHDKAAVKRELADLGMSIRNLQYKLEKYGIR